MAFEIAENETVPEAVRRMARELIDDASAQLTHPKDDPHEAVHEARKDFKKLRGLIRLVRSSLGDAYQLENACYRDAGRELSDVRDAQAMLETFEALRERYPNETRSLKGIGRRLERRRERIATADTTFDEKRSSVAARLDQARERVETWPVHLDRFDTLAEGLQRTYSRGRSAMAAAYQERSPHAFHEWRKRAKYSWYHAHILTPIWPPVMAALEKELHQLSTLLGDHHDLAVLRELGQTESAEVGTQRQVVRLMELVDLRQKELEDEAQLLGSRIYCDKPKAFRGRLAAWWQAWRGLGLLTET